MTAPTKPCLLLIPGMLNDDRVWRDVVAALAEEADIRIARVTDGLPIDEMARAAWDRIDASAPGSRLVVCGFSMGGYVAIEMLANPNRQIDSLVLLDTSGNPESTEGKAVRAKSIAAIEADFPRTIENILGFGIDKARRDDADLIARMREMMLDVGPQIAIAQNRAVAQRADHRALLARLGTPTIVACGRSDRITPPALSEELAGLIPGARLEWIENAGHMTPFEQPAAVAAVIRLALATA